MNAPTNTAVQQVASSDRVAPTRARVQPKLATFDSPTNGTARGILYALPVSVLLWAGLVYAVRSLL
jgi:hypothetical protein